MAPLIPRKTNGELSSQSNGIVNGLAEIKSLHYEDERLSKPSNVQQTTQDKVTFTVMTLSVAIAGFVIGRFPHYYYIFHTVIFIVAYAYRIVKFMQDGHQYLLIHLCYLVNALTLLYAWTSSRNSYLFMGLFFLANGPVIWTIPCMRNSVVPHSLNKMFSVYLHVCPALTLLGIKWNSVAKQNFADCPHGSEGELCEQVGWRELYGCAVGLWFLWMASYLMIVEVWRAKFIKENELMTFFKLLIIKQKSSIPYRFCSLLPHYKKGLFYIFEFFFMVVTISPMYLCYHWISLDILNVTLCVLIASYNGATYYISSTGRKNIESQENKYSKDYK